MRRLVLAALAVALAALVQSGAKAQPGQTTAPEFSITPYGWFAGLGGRLQTPLRRFPGRDLDASFGNVVSGLSDVPVMGMAEFRYGRFGLAGDLLYLGLSSDFGTRDDAFRGGEASVNSTIASAIGLFRVVDLPNQSLDLGAGARVYAARVKVTLHPGLLPGTIENRSTSWVDPVIAARYRLGLSDRFGVTLYGDVGGFGAGSEFAWGVMGTLDYRATDSIVLRAGWRYLTFERERRGFKLDLDFNGPFIAATFRF